MAVVCVRAAIRLDGRRAQELRLLAATAQANGGCDAVLSSAMEGPTIPEVFVTWSTVGGVVEDQVGNRTRGIVVCATAS